MKYILLVFFITVQCYSVLASEQCTTSSGDEIVTEQRDINTDVPKYLEGAKICVKLVSGKESCAPAEKFKVVPRKQQFIVEKTLRKRVTTCEAPREDKNRLSVLAGQGPKEGLDISKTSSQVSVESRVGTVIGVQYQRSLDLKIFGMPVNVGGQLQNNESALGTVGVDF